MRLAANSIGSSCTYEEIGSEEEVPGGKARSSRAGIEGKPLSHLCIGKSKCSVVALPLVLSL